MMPPEDEASAALRRFCAWAANLRPETVPVVVRARAAQVAADDIACAIAAAQEPAVRRLAVTLLAPHGTESTVLGAQPRRAARAEAARMNTIQANWCQLDEGHRHVMCHAGLYCVPAALAECEATGATLRAMLHAIVVGYEYTCRCALAWRFDPVRALPHPHACWSAIGSAATLAVLRGFDARAMYDTLSLAATLAMAGPFAQAARGAEVANVWAGLGVAQGFVCADMARAGLHATPDAMVQVFAGFGSARADVSALVSDLGDTWALAHGYHKRWACAGQAQAALQALLELRASLVPQGDRGTADVWLEAQVHTAALALDTRDPHTELGARFSLPHLLAVVWVHGRTDASALGAAFLADTEVRRLRDRVRLCAHTGASPTDRSAQVRVGLPGGDAIHHASCGAASGSPQRPLARSELAAKVGGLSQGQCAPLLALLLADADTLERHLDQPVDTLLRTATLQLKN